MSVPKLRFNEFEGVWLPMQIGDVGEIITGSTPITSESTYYNGDKLFVSPFDITNNRYVYETKTKLTETGFRKGRLVKSNSVLFVCIGSTIGKVAQNKFDCITNQQINAVVPSANFSQGFIYSRLENDAKKISQLAGEQAVPIINKTSFSKVIIYVPELNEQTKIANFFTAVDEKITQLTQKCDLLAQYKKGVMQQIFSQQLRFKDDDGRDFSDWEESKLKDLVSSPITYGVVKPGEYDINGVKLIRGGDIFQGKINKNLRTIKNEISSQYQRTILQGGELLVSLVGNPGEVALVTKDLIGANLARQVGLVRLTKEINSNFALYYLMFTTEAITSKVTGSVQQVINLEDLQKVNIKYPSLPEQTKIANFLNAIEDKISKNQSQLEAVKHYKQGLLQQMFV